MYQFFLTSSNNTSTGMESSHSTDTLSPGEIAGLVLGIIMILGCVGGAWRQYRCWCNNRGARVAPEAPEPNKIILRELKDTEGQVIAAYRVYPDGSVLSLPIDADISADSDNSDSEQKNLERKESQAN